MSAHSDTPRPMNARPQAALACLREAVASGPATVAVGDKDEAGRRCGGVHRVMEPHGDVKGLEGRLCREVFEAVLRGRAWSGVVGGGRAWAGAGRRGRAWVRGECGSQILDARAGGSSGVRTAMVGGNLMDSSVETSKPRRSGSTLVSASSAPAGCTVLLPRASRRGTNIVGVRQRVSSTQLTGGSLHARSTRCERRGARTWR